MTTFTRISSSKETIKISLLIRWISPVIFSHRNKRVPQRAIIPKRENLQIKGHVFLGSKESSSRAIQKFLGSARCSDTIQRGIIVSRPRALRSLLCVGVDSISVFFFPSFLCGSVYWVFIFSRNVLDEWGLLRSSKIMWLTAEKIFF